MPSGVCERAQWILVHVLHILYVSLGYIVSLEM